MQPTVVHATDLIEHTLCTIENGNILTQMIITKLNLQGIMQLNRLLIWYMALPGRLEELWTMKTVNDNGGFKLFLHLPAFHIFSIERIYHSPDSRGRFQPNNLYFILWNKIEILFFKLHPYLTGAKKVITSACHAHMCSNVAWSGGVILTKRDSPETQILIMYRNSMWQMSNTKKTIVSFIDSIQLNQ